jgi:hypothetical protein
VLPERQVALRDAQAARRQETERQSCVARYIAQLGLGAAEHTRELGDLDQMIGHLPLRQLRRAALDAVVALAEPTRFSAADWQLTAYWPAGGVTWSIVAPAWPRDGVLAHSGIFLVCHLHFLSGLSFASPLAHLERG